MATARFTLDGLARSAVRHDAVIALVYCAIALTLIEYLFIPRRASAWMGNGAVVGWLTPSMAAGLIWVLACLGFFFLLPYGFLRLIRADRPDDPDHPGHTGHTGQAALRFDLRGTHWRIYLLLYLMMLPVIFAASLRPEFIRVYPFVAIARSSLGYFALWEVAYLSQFFALEFFFRGFLLFTLARHMPKAVAIAAMVVPYTMIHYHKPMLEALGAIIGGCLLGYLALRYRSWVGGAFLHASVALTMDSAAVITSGKF